MIKERGDLILNMRRLVDLLVNAMAFIIAYQLIVAYSPGEGVSFLRFNSQNHNYLFFVTIPIWILVFDASGVYISYRANSLFNVLWATLRAAILSNMLMLLVIFLFALDNIHRSFFVLYFFLDLLLLAAYQTVIVKLLQTMRSRGINARNVLVVGSGPQAARLIQQNNTQSESGYRIVGILDVEKNRVGQKTEVGASIIGTIDNLETLVLEHAVDELAICMSFMKIPDVYEFLLKIEHMGISIHIMPELQIYTLGYYSQQTVTDYEDFLGMPSITIAHSIYKRPGFMIKAMFDYGGSLMLLIFLSPLLIAIATAIRLSSKGPVFFRQERIGLNGRRFTLYKFRTMILDAETQLESLAPYNEADGPVFKIKDDPRILPWIGHFLRKTCIDEIPQLFNVLKGEMSLIGPRPPLVHEVERYKLWQRRRLSIKPGLTCTWQITPERHDLEFKNWMKMDLDYIDNWSLWQDTKIFAATIITVLTARGR